MCFKLQFDFVALKKQRRKETRLITAANVIFLPVVICVAMVTAGLNIPLLPLFTYKNLNYFHHIDALTLCNIIFTVF